METAELIRKLTERDTQVLESFMEEYGVLLVKVISYVLQEPYEREYIEECYDDVILKILDKCKTYAYNASFKTWVATVAKYTALDYKRKLKKYYQAGEVALEDGCEESPEEIVLERYKVAVINCALNQLNEEEKRLFIRKFLLDATNEQLSYLYKVDKQVIYKRVSRLRKKMQALIEAAYRKEHING